MSISKTISSLTNLFGSSGQMKNRIGSMSLSVKMEEIERLLYEREDRAVRQHTNTFK